MIIINSSCIFCSPSLSVVDCHHQLASSRSWLLGLKLARSEQATRRRNEEWRRRGSVRVRVDRILAHVWFFSYKNKISFSVIWMMVYLYIEKKIIINLHKKRYFFVGPQLWAQRANERPMKRARSQRASGSPAATSGSCSPEEATKRAALKKGELKKSLQNMRNPNFWAEVFSRLLINFFDEKVQLPPSQQTSDGLPIPNNTSSIIRTVEL